MSETTDHNYTPSPRSEEEKNPWEELTQEEEEEQERQRKEGKKGTKGSSEKDRSEDDKTAEPPRKRGTERKKSTVKRDTLLSKKIMSPVWLHVSEAAKLAGVQTRTIRRALKAGELKYKIVGNRYYIDLKSLILYSHSSMKLYNKFKKKGLGQYVERWKK